MKTLGNWNIRGLAGGVVVGPRVTRGALSLTRVARERAGKLTRWRASWAELSSVPGSPAEPLRSARSPRKRWGIGVFATSLAGWSSVSGSPGSPAEPLIQRALRAKKAWKLALRRPRDSGGPTSTRLGPHLDRCSRDTNRLAGPAVGAPTATAVRAPTAVAARVQAAIAVGARTAIAVGARTAVAVGARTAVAVGARTAADVGPRRRLTLAPPRL